MYLNAVLSFQECAPGKKFDSISVHKDYDWHGSHICLPDFNNEDCNYDGGNLFFNRKSF